MAPATACRFECPFRRADGSSGWGLLQQSVVRDAAGEPTQVLVQLLDLTTRKEAERQLAHAADHDALTGLPNRACFERRADEAIASSPGALARALFVDIDDFKAINDSLGHGAGDRLLILVAERLRSRARARRPARALRRRRVRRAAAGEHRARGAREGRRLRAGSRGPATSRAGAGRSRPASD